MKNQKSIAIVLIAVFAFLLVGTYNSWPKVVNASGGHVHHYSSATCTTPKECDCGETTGEALGHNWSDYVQNSTSTGHYEKCNRCGIKRNEESCKDGTLQYHNIHFHSYQDCSVCDKAYNYEEHVYNVVQDGDDKNFHIIKCDICGHEEYGIHLYDDNHVCTSAVLPTGSIVDGCGFEHPMEDHWFPEKKGHCALYNSTYSEYTCSAELECENYMQEIDEADLPKAKEYTIVGCQPEIEMEEKTLDYVTVRYNYIPYITESGTLLQPTITISEYKHGNYEEHATEAAIQLHDYGVKINDDVFAAGNVDKTRENWTSSSELNYYQAEQGYIYDYAYFNQFLYLDDPAGKVYNLVQQSDKKLFKADMPASGHYEIQEYYVLGQGDNSVESAYTMLEKPLFCNGGCNPPIATDIYGYVMVGYRELNGVGKAQKLPASFVDDLGHDLADDFVWNPEDSRDQGLVWKEGMQNSGKYTRLNIDPKIKELDKAGYKYLGYRITNTFVVPTKEVDPDELTIDRVNGKINVDKKYNIETTFGHQRKCITFYYEKVDLAAEHWLVETDENGNIKKDSAGNMIKERLLPTNLNNNLDTSYYNFEVYPDEGELDQYEPYLVDQIIGTQTERSVNKEIYPGYILVGYNKYVDKNLDKDDNYVNHKVKESTNNVYEQYANKIYDYKYSGNGEATTRPLTSDERQVEDINVDGIIYKKIEIPYDDYEDDEVGERKDKKIEFYYKSVDVKITHKDKTNNTIMSGNDRITNNPVSLTYTKTLTGQQLNEVSLDLKNENATMYMNGRAVVYSAVGYALDSIKIKMDGLPEIEINKQLLDECVQTQTRYKYMSDTFNMSFRLDMDNQFIQVVIQQALRKVGVNDNQIADLSNRMQRNTEITWCYVLGEKLIIKHETENGISLTSPETIPITTNPVTPVPKPKYFDGYEFVSYKLDGHHTTDLTDEQKNTIINNGLSVERTGNDRELIFIYQPQEQEVVDGRIVELRSASRREELTSDYKSEEYSVDGKLLAGDAENANKGAIPTSEDLYANVMVEEFNIKSGAQLKANINETQRFEIYFVQQYVERNEEEDSNSTSDQQYATEDNIIKLSVADELIEFDLGYNYYTAENAELQIINYANVKNEHIIQNPNEEPSNFGFAKLVPQYAREPRMEFVRGGSLTVDKSNNTEISDGRVVSAALPSGLYNVDDTSEPGVIKAYFVLSSVEYSTPTIKDLVSKYDEDPSIMGAEIGELRDNILKTTKVKLDLLRVLSSIPSRNPEYYTIFSGADVYLLDAQNLDVLIQAGHIDLTPEVALIERDVLYSENQKNKEKGYNEIYIKENTLNEIEDTKADVYYKTVQKLKEGIFYNVGSDGKFYEQLSVGSDGTPIFSNTPNEDMGLAEKENRVIKDEPGNSIKVHTPVVDYAEIKMLEGTEVRNTLHETNDTMHGDARTTAGSVDETLILGGKFTIKIPHNGEHRNDLKGYKDNNNTDDTGFNWKGIFINKNGINGADGEPKFEDGVQLENAKNSFAKDRQIKFSFDVFYYENGLDQSPTYLEANKWYSLGVNEKEIFNFAVPEWTEERWKTGKHEIKTRVIAENCPENYYKNSEGFIDANNNYIEEKANKESNHYIAYKDFKVNVIGEILDLEIRATNDYGWPQLNSSVATTGEQRLPLGEPGQNINKAYKYGIKLGYSAFFDVTTTGWTGDTTENIKITPKYYYVSKDGEDVYKVDLFYKTSATGQYKSLRNNALTLDTIMNIDNYKGTNYVSRYAKLFATTNPAGTFALDAGRELTLTYEWLKDKGATIGAGIPCAHPVINYSNSIEIGNTNQIKLPYATRAIYQKAIETLFTKYKIEDEEVKNEINSKNGTDYCIGHWYGAIYLPSSTVAVPTNPDGSVPTPPKPDGTGKLPSEGYIIITLDDVIATNGDGSYLQYSPDAGFNPEIELPNGETVNLSEEFTDPGIPGVIYEMFSDRVDWNPGMTH